MPLTGNASKDISELMDAYSNSGKIGNTKPRNRKHAQRIAVAIAMQTERESKSRKGKRNKKKHPGARD